MLVVYRLENVSENKMESKVEYNWKAIHKLECRIYHKITSSSMESVGSVEILNWSISKGLIYDEYLLRYLFIQKCR